MVGLGYKPDEERDQGGRSVFMPGDGHDGDAHLCSSSSLGFEFDVLDMGDCEYGISGEIICVLKPLSWRWTLLPDIRFVRPALASRVVRLARHSEPESHPALFQKIITSRTRLQNMLRESGELVVMSVFQYQPSSIILARPR